MIKEKPNIVEYEAFFQYSAETKSYILDNSDDEIILNQVSKIPDVNLAEMETSSSIFGGLVSLAAPGLGVYFKEAKQKNAAEGIIHELKGCYGSLEFMLNNTLK